MTSIPESVRDFLQTGPLGHVVTLDPEGSVVQVDVSRFYGVCPWTEPEER
jgi:hypothetical protein